MLSAAAALLTVGASAKGWCDLLVILRMEAAMARALLAFIMGLIAIADVRYFCIPELPSPLVISAGMVANAFVFVVASGSPRPCRSTPARWREGIRSFGFESSRNGNSALGALALAT